VKLQVADRDAVLLGELEGERDFRNRSFREMGSAAPIGWLALLLSRARGSAGIVASATLRLGSGSADREAGRTMPGRQPEAGKCSVASAGQPSRRNLRGFGGASG
jgi:hypothetical protein